MRTRRAFITLLGGAAAWRLAARAQQAQRMRRIGVLLVSGPEPLGPFREALRELGCVEGRNIQMEVLSAGVSALIPALSRTHAPKKNSITQTNRLRARVPTAEWRCLVPSRFWRSPQVQIWWIARLGGRQALLL
jgi:hypothetical protein